MKREFFQAGTLMVSMWNLLESEIVDENSGDLVHDRTAILLRHRSLLRWNDLTESLTKTRHVITPDRNLSQMRKIPQLESTSWQPSLT